MTEEQKGALQNALEYFRTAAPRHTADEEESLFPRLRAMNCPDVEIALAEMDALEADHERASRWHAEVERLGLRWIEQERLSSDDVEQLSEALVRLKQLYDRRIALETGVWDKNPNLGIGHFTNRTFGALKDIRRRRDSIGQMKLRSR